MREMSPLLQQCQGRFYQSDRIFLHYGGVRRTFASVAMVKLLVLLLAGIVLATAARVPFELDGKANSEIVRLDVSSRSLTDA